jgi:anti-sigma factor RsiW
MTLLRRWGRAEKMEPPSCVTVREAISASLDGETPGIRTKVYETHLASCPECRLFQVRVSTLTHQIGLQSSRPAPHALKVLLGTELARTVGPSPLGSPSPGRVREGLRWRRRARWIGALAPAVVAAAFLPFGALSSAHGLPTHAPTPCTLHLRSHPSSPVAPHFIPFLAEAGQSS